MLLLIDNYDSFVYNLSRYFGLLGYERRVVRNDQISLQDIAELRPSHIVLSPGPCTPDEAGICLDIIKNFGSRIPILGVCLGHQVIGQSFGAFVSHAKYPKHGKTSLISHNGNGIFNGLDNPLKVARYHSLIVSEEKCFPQELEITARCEEGEIMAISHRQFPVFGVQFHPESILTNQGLMLLKNFLDVHKNSNATSI